MVQGIDYKEYIHSLAWYEKKMKYRKSKLPQDCVVCGSKEKIHLHHKSYARLGNEKLHDLVPLCESCHAEVHKMVKASTGKRTNNWTAVRKLRKLKNKRTPA